MPRTRVEVVGLRGIVANLYKGDMLIKGAIRTLNARMAQETRSVAQSICPVRTGRMRRSLKYRMTDEGLKFTVFYDPADYSRDGVPYYAPYVEFGTSRMAARPTLIPAFEQIQPEYRNGVREAVRDAIRRIR